MKESQSPPTRTTPATAICAILTVAAALSCVAITNSAGEEPFWHHGLAKHPNDVARQGVWLRNTIESIRVTRERYKHGIVAHCVCAGDRSRIFFLVLMEDADGGWWDSVPQRCAELAVSQCGGCYSPPRAVAFGTFPR
jgi:hypothetical protein